MMIKIAWKIIILIILNYNLCSSFFSSGYQYSPFTIIVNENDHLSFSCSLLPQSSKTLWIKYGLDFKPIQIKNNSIHTILSDGSLHIVKLEERYSYYQCAQFVNDRIQFEKLFKIISIGHLRSQSRVPEDSNWVQLRDVIVLTSGVVPSDNLQLMWLTRTDHGLVDVSATATRAFGSWGSSITMKALPRLVLSGQADMNVVACLVTPESRIISHCDRPHLIRSGRLEDKGQRLLYAEDSDGIILRCGGDNKLFKHQWYRNGKLIKFGKRLKNYGNMIIIESITEQDYGHYECLTKKPLSMPYNLSIFLINFFNSSNLFRPVIVKHENSFILPCTNPSGEIPKFVYWNYNIFYRLSRGLDLKNSVPNYNMYMRNSPSRSSGLYQCFLYSNGKLHIFSNYVQTPHQESVHNTEQVILKKRSVDETRSILNLKLTAFSNIIQISWAPPAIPIKSYMFHWGEQYPGPDKQVVNGKESKFVIESLKPNTNYFIKIDIDAINGSAFSIHEAVMTKAENKEIILTIPVNLKLVEVADTSSKISWDYRDNGYNKNKTYYQIEYYPIRGQTGHKKHLNTSLTSITINKISPATTYEFMVRNCLINSSKCSDWSMVLEFTSQETKPSDPPQQLTLSTIQLKNVPSDNSQTKHRFAVQVSWQPPKKPNGEIKNYLILVTADKRLEINDWIERTVSGKALNTVIDRLDLDRYYYFRIGCSNDYGKSPFSPIRIFKTPDKNGRNGGPIILSKDYYDVLEINEELKISVSNERGNDNLQENNTENQKNKDSKNDKIISTNHKWWIIIGIVVGATLVFILIILFLVASKCKNENVPYENGVKMFNSKNICDMEYIKQKNELVKFVNKGPILTTPDLFRHTNDQNCHQNYLEMEDRTESPNSFSSNKGFSSQGHNQTFTSQPNYRGIPGHYTPPGLIHQQNIVMTTSQLTSNSNDRQFYQVPFLHHMGHNPLNVFTSSAPRVNAAASDFNSINIPSPISGYSDFTSSQATVLYDTSTAKSSGGKSSLSGSGSYNNGLGNKVSLINEPINEVFNNSDKNPDLKTSKSSDTQHLISKAFSSEELTQEMANLEGLMKDLNSITQKEFEC